MIRNRRRRRTDPPITPAERLRLRVVTCVIVGIIGLTFALYGLIGYIVIERGADAVPGALWQAAGTFGGAIITFLLNSKLDAPNTATVDLPSPSALELTPAADPPPDEVPPGALD